MLRKKGETEVISQENNTSVAADVVVAVRIIVTAIVVVVVVVIIITWWLGNVRMVFFVGIIGVVSVVGNAIFSHVGIISFVVAFVVREMMASAATTSRREVDERRKCGPLAT